MIIPYRPDPLDGLFRRLRRGSQTARYMTAAPREDPRRALARRVERDARERLSARGHFVTGVGHNERFDLLVDGLRVEVKAATWSGARYQANLRGNRADALVLGCVRPGDISYFVIPFDEAQGLRALTIWTEDPATYAGRWRPYLEAWDVIETLIARGVNAWQPALLEVATSHQQTGTVS